MKKVLLATTALALSAGVAAADVSFSGNARFGLQTNDGTTTLEKRMTLTATGSKETDSGVSFGASLNLRSNENSDTYNSGARVYMKSGNIEVGVGNINGAIEWMPGLYDPSVGLTGLGWGGLVTNTDYQGYWGWDAYSSSGNGAEGVEVMFSSGAFSGHLSYTDSSLAGNAYANRLAGYGAYTMGDWTVALGMQHDRDYSWNDKTVLTVAGKVGDANVGFAYADNDGESKIALNGSATFGATTVSGYVADEESLDFLLAGVGVSYDLGGASLKAGLARASDGDYTAITRADVGVSFSF